MKKISIVIPCYNEEENVVEIYNAVVDQLKMLNNYDYEIIFIDNCSKDKTREKIESLCDQNIKVKAIFNTRNFGQFSSPVHAMLQAEGDCVIPICADFQDPVELIPTFVREWENGYKIVCGIKSKSEENKIMRFIRTCYYKIVKRLSDVDQLEHFTGFALYDKSFLDILRKLDDPMPFIRGLVAEFGFKRKEIEYNQPRRRAGKTSNNFYILYDAAMLSFTSYTKVGMRIATFLGMAVSIISFIAGFVYLVLKLLYWDRFPGGTTPALIGTFFIGAVQLFFIGFLGEYVMHINSRIMKRPLVVEEKRLNFEDCQN